MGFFSKLFGVRSLAPEAPEEAPEPGGVSGEDGVATLKLEERESAEVPIQLRSSSNGNGNGANGHGQAVLVAPAQVIYDSSAPPAHGSDSTGRTGSGRTLTGNVAAAVPHRPPPPKAVTPQAVEELGAVIDGLDGAFDAVFADETTPVVFEDGRLATDAATAAQLEQLFAQIAAQYVGQVRDFMIELSVGATTKQWVEIVRPAVSAINGASVTMSKPALGVALEEFEAALELAAEAEGTRIDGPAREELLVAYQRLCVALPAAFVLSEARNRREPVIVHSLLAQVDGVFKVTIDRVYAAGVTTLDALCHANAHDLSATAGIDEALAERIVAKFQHYWASRTEASPEDAQVAALGKLSRMIASLEAQQREFRDAESTDDTTRKRSIRQARQQLLLDVNVVLAQSGQVELVDELSRLAVDRKIERLSSYLRETLQG